MRDEMDARLWVEHHEEFSQSIAELIGRIRTAFERLHAITFAAPWRQEVRRAGPRQA